MNAATKTKMWMGLMVSALFTAGALAEDPVYFADANLKTAVEQALGKTNPTPTDMLKLLTLQASNRGIRDLTGLEHALNIANLQVPDNWVSDISSLAPLTKLQHLDLGGNKIADISAVSSLGQLRWISLWGDGLVTDISALAGHGELQEVYLTRNQIRDISALSTCTKLRILGLNRNQITDVSALQGLTMLEVLRLEFNSIDDIAPLANLTRLTELTLCGNRIHDISGLSQLTALKILNLHSNAIGDLRPLSGLLQLADLRLAANEITDISPLAPLTGLTTLVLGEYGIGGNNITDVSPLQAMTKLTDLNLSSNQIRDVTALKELTNLTFLNLGHNQITDISPLSGMADMNDLYLWDNQIEDLAPLSGMHKLAVLWLGLNRITDISPLHSLSNLQRMTLSGNQIADLSPLTDLRSLSYIDARANPLNTAAHNTHIPQITANNPGIELLYDEPQWRTLTVTATVGGSVLQPGEGEFKIVNGEVLSIEAVIADASYEFARWGGTATTVGRRGKVADQFAPQTTVLVDGDYTLEAIFVPRVDELPLGFSLGEITVDDPQEFEYRVATNNTPEATFVEVVTGLALDPNGVVRMQVIEEEPARAKVRFGKSSAQRLFVQFEYLFETADATEIIVYLSDVPGLLDRGDPSWTQHYVEIGRVPAPPEGCAGSFGSGRFGTFETWALVEGLDFSNGTWVELELVQNPETNVMSARGGIHLAAAGGSRGKALFDKLAVQVHCPSGICMNVTWDTAVDWQDLLLVMASCGGTTAASKASCLDGLFSDDGYVDAFDGWSWDWVLEDLSRAQCGNLCRVPLSNSGSAAVGASLVLPASVGGLRATANPWPAGLLVLGKPCWTKTIPPDPKPYRFYLFDGEPNYVADYYAPGLPESCNMRLVPGLAGQVYLINSQQGVLELSDASVTQVITPGQTSYSDDPRYHTSATVSIGLQGQGGSSFGRPIFDAAFDANGYAYVVPAVVQPAGQQEYIAAAKLQLQGNGAWQLIQLYDDPPAPNDNRRRNYLREIEVDSAGNVYTLNVHHLNESCILYKYSPDGSVDKSLSLLDPNSPVRVEDPIALHLSRDGGTVYLACGQYNSSDPDSAVIYALSTEDFSAKPSITIEGMQLVSSITQDPATEDLWVGGFSRADIASSWNPLGQVFYVPCIARIRPGETTIEATDLSTRGTHDLVLPTSMVWTGQ